jgi:hypothetical protein
MGVFGFCAIFLLEELFGFKLRTFLISITDLIAYSPESDMGLGQEFRGI